MGGERLRAGRSRPAAELVDMEFVQFFPIGPFGAAACRHGPDHVGPVSLQARRPAARRRWAGNSSPITAATRPAGVHHHRATIATYAIQKEVAAGRGSPAWRVFISPSAMCRAARLEMAFGPVIERLAKNGIDLGTISGRGRADRATTIWAGSRSTNGWRQRVPGLFAAGEGGRAAAKRRQTGSPAMRSPEALVFGEQAGRAAAPLRDGTAGCRIGPERAGVQEQVDRIRSLLEGRKGGRDGRSNCLNDMRER